MLAWNDLSVTDISFHPSSQNPNGHKSIGAGGSFWLPPKMKTQTFESSFKNYSGLNDASKIVKATTTKEIVRQGNSSTKVLSDTGQVQEIRAVQSRHSGAAGSMPKEIPPTAGQKISANPNLSNPQLVRQWGELTRVNIASVAPPVLPMIIRGSRLGFSPSGNSSMLGKNKQDLRPRDMIPSNGTRIAHLKSSKNEAYSQNTEQNPENDFSSYNKSLTESEVVDEIKGSLADMSLHSSHRNGVVRFAFSLENGSSVSVRIEQMKDHFQICFICDDKSSLVSLSKKFKSTGNHLNPTELPLHIHFFDSYKQMDNVLSSTPSFT